MGAASFRMAREREAARLAAETATGTPEQAEEANLSPEPVEPPAEAPVAKAKPKTATR